MTRKTFKWKRVAIDLDGTLIQNPDPKHGTTDDYFRRNWYVEPVFGAQTITKWLREQGFEILIYTCRQDYQRKYIETILEMHGTTYDYIVFYAKPHADLYIDDKGFRFTDWDTTQEWIEQRLKEDDMKDETI